MKTYAILRQTDNGAAMPDGFKAKGCEWETQLALVSALLETVGYYVDFETCDGEKGEEESDCEKYHEEEDGVTFVSLDAVFKKGGS